MSSCKHALKHTCLMVAGFAATLLTAAPAGAQRAEHPNLLPSAEVPAITRRDTSIDSSGIYREEVQACLSGESHQAKDACLEEARHALAAKRRGNLETEGDLMANALARCGPLLGEELASCQARVMGFGNASGSVAGGGLLRWVETVVLPPGNNQISFVPRTTEPVVVLPTPNS